jgi:hypothetical protein
LNAGAENDISIAETCGVKLIMVGGSGTVNTTIELEEAAVESPTVFDALMRTI